LFDNDNVNGSLDLTMDSRIGFHVSISGGISNSIDNALKIGCGAFQIFTRSPMRWSAKPLQEEEVKNFRKKLGESKIDIDAVFVHMPYLPNLSSPNDKLHKKSVDVLTEEIKRCSVLGIPYLVSHLGTHGGKGKGYGISQLVKGCNFAFRNYYKSLSKAAKNNSHGIGGKESVTILLENSAGHKYSIGGKFDEIGLILDKLDSSSSGSRGSFGVCLDSCHAFVAGYDLRKKDGAGETLDKFSSEVGLKRLKLVHLNDSKDKFNSNRDRHEHIGLGKIGKEGFKALLKDKAVKNLPIIMETPIDKRRDNSDNLKVVVDIINRK
jgi:deoxyribonuclease-4